MRIAITGGTGSLGSALIRRLAASGAERIVTFSRDEQRRLALSAEMSWHPGVKVYAGDVRDAGRMADIFHGCDVVVHAAARKVVNGHHDEPREMLQTNVLGTQHVISAARQAHVPKLLFISSDKAVHPENVYGVSKAMAEHLVVSENARSYPQGGRMAVLRYGNVIASNGSVVKLWRQCVAAREPLPVTDGDMTRFWLTLADAVELVMLAIAQMRGGEIFVPILRAAPLHRLADAVAEDLPRRATGIRSGGEKLFEELLSADEARRAVRRNGFFVVTPTKGMDSWDTTPWLGDPLPPGFTYRSDTWPDQWSVEDLRTLLEVQA